ncbi:MAG: hypothetical protein JL50_16550 [Peptococcaceae bacterium BICA1-7]|nr:MAG: hypothetical protein JL50_16550 [Peptococcaceae bacterium BICA1-7]
MREIQPSSPANPVVRGDVGVSEKQPVKKNSVEEENKEEKQESLSVEKAVELLNKTMESYTTELKFKLHKDSGEYIVKIINTKDNSVIREIPPERVLNMVAHFKKMLGIIVDKFI